MDLTVGPNFFFWPAETVRAFYRDLAPAPVARVVLGELVCSKRLPFWQGEIPGAVETLLAAGKEVAMTSLALITLKRERKLTADLQGLGLPVEVNDLTALGHVAEGQPFWVGPLVNVYNEGTLRWLIRRGARRVCLPPELTLASIAVLARVGREEGIAVEVWGHGRLPLAISGRCYHARLHDRAKDSCQFVCEQDPDGRDVETLDGQPFLSVNGVQTLSQSTASMAYRIEALRDAGSPPCVCRHSPPALPRSVLPMPIVWTAGSMVLNLTACCVRWSPDTGCRTAFLKARRVRLGRVGGKSSFPHDTKGPPSVQTFAAQTLNRPCPVTSRTSPRACSTSRLRCTAARLAPVSASACGAASIGWAASAAINRAGVRPDRSAVSSSVRLDHPTSRSSVISAASTARCAPRVQA